MHQVSVHPSAFNFVGVLTLDPVKQDCSAQSCLANLGGIIQVIVHSSAKIVCKADVQDNPSESGEDVAATLFRDKALSAPLEGFAVCRLRHKLADVHIST